VGEEIDYEMAGVPLSACRMSEDIHDIKVINKETVSASPEHFSKAMCSQGPERKHAVLHYGDWSFVLCHIR
jgi:hypothetical protein